MWQDLYDEIANELSTSEIGINPVDYMKRVPTNYHTTTKKEITNSKRKLKKFKRCLTYNSAFYF